MRRKGDSKNKRRWIVAILFLIIGILILAGAYFAFFGDEKGPQMKETKGKILSRPKILSWLFMRLTIIETLKNCEILVR